MNALTTITPVKAVELVEGAGIDNARRIIADFAAAGLVKSYALVIEMIDARGVSESSRGATIPAEVWGRIVRDAIADDVWTSGTVSLAGSLLIGGEPTAKVTGITFSAKHIDWLIAHHNGVPTSRRSKRKAALPVAVSASSSTDAIEDAPLPSTTRRRPDPTAIPEGAIPVSYTHLTLPTKA